MVLVLLIRMLGLVLLAPDIVTSCGDNICYEDLGCFPNDPPWCSLLRPIPLPLTPGQIQTRFYLYTRLRPIRFVVPTWPEISLTGSGYNSSLLNVFIVHGLFGSGNMSAILDTKDAILSKINVNVFIVDWGRGASSIDYTIPVANTRVVGQEMARLGLFLINNYEDTTPANFYLIGHSLGAQVCSYVGKIIHGIWRITALDPAQPLFEGYSGKVHLKMGDAKYVDVMHTDAKPFYTEGGYGMIEPTGDVDFYVNGGEHQPGCPPLTSIPITGSFYFSCPHLRAVALFRDAVQFTNCTFWGHKTTFKNRKKFRLDRAPNCTLDTCSPMGLWTFNYPARGIFYVNTTGKSPFCILDKETDIIMEREI